MNYYQHHIGDFIKVTARLSDAQTMAYLRLLWLYYDTEKPLPDDPKLLAFQLGTTEEVVDLLLATFFDKQEDGWHQARCDKEIEEYKAFRDKKIAAGKASAEKKGYRSSTPVQQPFNTCSTDVQLTTIQQPLAINHGSFNKEPNTSLSGTTFPPCPHQEILNLWKKNLPHLAQPRSWEGSRVATLKARWIQAAKPSSYSEEGYATVQEGLEWWDSFFTYIAKHSTLAKGYESNGRVWTPDLPWVLNATNFQKIVDGKYDK